MSVDANDRSLLDTETVAVALGITSRHVRRLVAAGYLTNHGTPRRIRISIGDVQRHADHKAA